METEINNLKENINKHLKTTDSVLSIETPYDSKKARLKIASSGHITVDKNNGNDDSGWESLGELLKYNMNVPSGSDMNNYAGSGFFSGQNLKNAPASGWVQWISLPANGNSNYACQIAVTQNEGEMYVRVSYGGSFKGWRKISTS